MRSNSKKIITLIIFLCIFNFIFANKQSVGKSIVKSALIPGWGEISNGNKTGYIFFSNEVFLWFTKYYFHRESSLYEEASKYQARKYAHIDPIKNYSDQFYLDLKGYMSSGFESGGFNANVVQEAKEAHPDSLDLQQNYILEHMYSDEFSWHWDDKDRKYDYKILRKRITEYSDYAATMTGFIILNHIVSAINSARISAKLKKFDLQLSLKNNKPYLSCKYKF